MNNYSELHQSYRAKKRSRVVSISLALALFVSYSLFPVKKANACGSCYAMAQSADSSIWLQSENNFDRYLDREFKQLQSFIIEEMWEQSILPAMMLAAEQFTAVALHQAMAIGMFIDAQGQLEAQRTLQEIQAKVHKQYHPSVGMCEFGSVTKSLASTEILGETTARVLRRRSLDRQLGTADSSATYGNDLDQYMRLMQFRDVFCNEHARTAPGGVSVLGLLCEPTRYAGLSEEQRERTDKDIDYFTLLDNPWNLKIDFLNDEITDTGAVPPINNQDEEHLMALSANLFSHTTFPRPPAGTLVNRSEDASTMQKLYLDLRAIIAKRGVAENSLFAISSMKTPSPTFEPAVGTTREPISSRKYMEHILGELGVPNAEILDVLGENPSYYAQMEILTKKLYQNPDFYTNLYDKPVNVERKAVAMQAIKLMQKFDMLKSFLRGEASVSILLEIAVADFQKEIEDQIQAIGN